jgi:hypothetical protein
VYWPSGEVDTVLNPPINQSIYIEEGSTSVGLNDYFLTDLAIFPVPTTDQLNIVSTTSLENHIISVFDSNGKRVLNKKYDTAQIDVSKLSKGMYFLQIENKGQKRVQKFIKE